MSVTPIRCAHEWTLEPRSGVAECALCGRRMSRFEQYRQKARQVQAIFAPGDGQPSPPKGTSGGGAAA